MERIGNDIVDLEQEGREPVRDLKRFCARVFTPRETAFLLGRGWRVRDVWSFWAAKEAAFKALHRERAVNRFDFVPREFEVRPTLTGRRAAVHWGSRNSSNPGRPGAPAAVLCVRFDQQEGCVHAVCEDVDSPPALTLIGRYAPGSGSESEAVRELVFRCLNERFGIARTELTIVGGGNSGWPPEILWRTGPGGRDRTRVPVSLSHHGQWLAAALPGACVRALEFDQSRIAVY